MCKHLVADGGGLVGFPDINQFPQSDPESYERQMGGVVVELLELFSGRVPDSESNTRVRELAANPSRWSAGHAVFDEVRRLLLAAEAEDELRARQYDFEETCCKVIYNATEPPDPFDSGLAFFIAGESLALAKAVGVPVEAVIAVLTRC